MIPAAPRLETCVWEVTLACNSHCVHCGSVAGRSRERELDTSEALALIDDLAALGCRSVTLSGGEPLLRPDWPHLARAIREAGMQAELISNGLLVAGQVEAIAGAGFFGVTLSVDGPAEAHDRLRGVSGGLDRLLAGARALSGRGVRVGAVTQVNRRNLTQLEAIYDLLLLAGFEGWQVQLTMPRGRAAAHGDALCLDPDELPALEQALQRLIERGQLFIQAADNVGYMGKSEPVIRSGTGQPERLWTGCRAGLQVVGITSDGAVRGCLSLPAAFDEGSLRERSLESIWNDPDTFAYNRRFRVEDLSGSCAGCPFGALCRGGCRSLTHAATGGIHSNPYCLSRSAGRPHPARGLKAKSAKESFRVGEMGRDGGAAAANDGARGPVPTTGIKTERASVLLIVADSLRPDSLGCLGGVSRTPTVDRLAREGVLFERVVSAAPWTVPSVASLLTGIYSHRLGLAKWEQPWPEAHPSLFDLARQSGLQVASFVFDPAYFFCRVPAAGVAGSSQDTRAVLSWLDEHSRFFLFVHYWWTHIPYISTPMTTDIWREMTDRVLAVLRDGEEARAGVKRLYHLAVERFSEEWLSRLLSRVDLDTTWIVVTSDHGESWGERAETAQPRDVFDLHGNTLYDEVLRVPLVIRPPGGRAALRVGGLVRTVDIMPTLADLLGLSFDPTLAREMDGSTLAPCVNGSDAAPTRDAVSVMSRDFVELPHLPEDPKELWCGLALTQERYKQIWEPKKDRRLAFDLLADPGETTDVSTIHADELAPGWRRLAEELERARVAPMLPEDVKRGQQRLRDLGYI